MTPYLFVYASLRSGFKSPAYSYITQFFRPVGEGVVKGNFYYTGEIPVAIAGTDIIQGELYELKDPADFNWAFGQLDDYEGMNVEPDEIPLYKRDLVTVISGEKTFQSWIYWYNRPVHKLMPIAASDVLKLLDANK